MDYKLLRQKNKQRFEAWLAQGNQIDLTPRRVKRVHSPVRWDVSSTTGRIVRWSDGKYPGVE